VDAGVESVPPRKVVAYDVPEHRTSRTSLPGQEDAPEQSADAPFDSMVYATGADRVVPPVGVRPQLPRQLPTTVKLAELSRIELIIGRDGLVESAKLLGDRRDLPGGMFLSAAKSWRFRPATKDGIAVRYRTTVLVSFE
jgi:hypothetical protein